MGDAYPRAPQRRSDYEDGAAGLAPRTRLFVTRSPVGGNKIARIATRGLFNLIRGPRRVGSRALVADVEAPQGLGVALGFEGWPVVGHDALDTDTVAAEEPQGVEEEGEAGGPGLVGQDLGVGQPRMVVDGQVQELPADAAA